MLNIYLRPLTALIFDTFRVYGVAMSSLVTEDANMYAAIFLTIVLRVGNLKVEIINWILSFVPCMASY
jgi:hypothetical protein